MTEYGFNYPRGISRTTGEVFRIVGLALFFAIGILLIALAASREVRATEPGDKYESLVRWSPPAPRATYNRHQMPSATVVGGRPSQCPVRAWCGCFLEDYFGLRDRSLWVARNWINVGRPAQRGCINCIAVLRRGARGGHVGVVRSYDEHGNPVIYSGNHNNAVGVGTYPASRVLAYRSL